MRGLPADFIVLLGGAWSAVMRINSLHDVNLNCVQSLDVYARPELSINNTRFRYITVKNL